MTLRNSLETLLHIARPCRRNTAFYNGTARSDGIQKPPTMSSKDCIRHGGRHENEKQKYACKKAKPPRIVKRFGDPGFCLKLRERHEFSRNAECRHSPKLFTRPYDYDHAFVAAVIHP